MSRWHCDNDDGFVYSYTTSGRADRISQFELSGTNDDPVAMAFGNDRLWVVDNDGMVYAYSGTVVSGFGPVGGINTGIAFGDGRIWIVDTGYPFDRKTDDALKIFSTTGSNSLIYQLPSNPDDPTGIAFGNDRVWIVDEIDDRVYAYTTDRKHDSASGFGLKAENDAPAGIAFGDGRFWVVDHADDAVYAYESDGTYDPASGFGLYAGNTSPTGIAFGDGRFWVVDCDDAVRTYPAGQLPPVPIPWLGEDPQLDPRVTSLEARVTDLETVLAGMKAMISSIQDAVAELAARITALETGTQPPGPATPAPLSGTVFRDSNGNGQHDSGEPGVSGLTIITVDLSDLSNVTRAVTGSEGMYSLDEISPGAYLVQIEGYDIYNYVAIPAGQSVIQDFAFP